MVGDRLWGQKNGDNIIIPYLIIAPSWFRWGGEATEVLGIRNWQISPHLSAFFTTQLNRIPLIIFCRLLFLSTHLLTKDCLIKRVGTWEWLTTNFGNPTTAKIEKKESDNKVQSIHCTRHRDENDENLWKFYHSPNDTKLNNLYLIALDGASNGCRT
jgi:hypothetical protein